MSEHNLDSILSHVPEGPVKIGIGSVQKQMIIEESIKKLVSENSNISVGVYTQPEELINDLKNNIIQGAVRGNLPAAEILGYVKSAFEAADLMRANLLKTSASKYFFIAPVGIDECMSIEQKLELVKHFSSWLSLFSIVPEVAVLSGGRLEDFGRSKEVDETMTSAEELTGELTKIGFNVRNYGILIEDAVNSSNLLIVPNGVIGNFIFRTLYHLGGGDSIGAPVLNLPEIFIDTSRTKKDYSSAIMLAAVLADMKNR